MLTKVGPLPKHAQSSTTAAVNPPSRMPSGPAGSRMSALDLPRGGLRRAVNLPPSLLKARGRCSLAQQSSRRDSRSGISRTCRSRWRGQGRDAARQWPHPTSAASARVPGDAHLGSHVLVKTRACMKPPIFFRHHLGRSGTYPCPTATLEMARDAGPPHASAREQLNAPSKGERA
jgi:hypothetical protein